MHAAWHDYLDIVKALCARVSFRGANSAAFDNEGQSQRKYLSSGRGNEYSK